MGPVGSGDIRPLPWPGFEHCRRSFTWHRWERARAELMAQLVGIATLLGFVLPLTYGVNWMLNRIYPYRVSIEPESFRASICTELGAGAYQKCITRTPRISSRDKACESISRSRSSDSTIRPELINFSNPCHPFFEFALSHFRQA